MTKTLRALTAVALAAGVSGTALPAQAASAPAAKKFTSCTQLNRGYPHGVARKAARDLVRGRTKPVTTFRVDTALYQANARLDRDKDGVACEKR